MPNLHMSKRARKTAHRPICGRWAVAMPSVRQGLKLVGVEARPMLTIGGKDDGGLHVAKVFHPLKGIQVLRNVNLGELDAQLLQLALRGGALNARWFSVNSDQLRPFR